MGLDTNRPPLPAPTEPSTLDSTDNDTSLHDDVDTNVSTRTDKTSYSIPEDGTPVTINTFKHALHKKYPSQTSLLIEYFEGGKSDPNARSRPSVRVRVTPSSRKNKSASTASDHVQITHTSRATRRPAYTRRISLGSKPRDEIVHTDIPHTELDYYEDSNVSSLPPVEIEVLQDADDFSSIGGRFMPMASDVSSMPPDSMLESELAIKTPGRRRSRSLERSEVAESKAATDTLKAPTRQRSRSLSKERITARVMEKLQQQEKLQQKPVENLPLKTREKRSSKEELSASRKARHRTSKTSRDEESGISGTDSSLLSSNVHRRSGDTTSMRSAVSGTSSINNPKLLATVEDAIKRLILPELTALKEEQRSQKNRQKFDDGKQSSVYETVDSSKSRDGVKRRVSKSSSAPHMHGSKPKVVLNRDENDPGTTLSGGSSHKGRRSSRGSMSERSYADSTMEDKARHKKSRDSSRHSTREKALAGLAGAGLTAAALQGHNAREEKEERRERRKRHSKSRSRTASISGSVDDGDYLEEPIPALPMLRSELQSDITRDSILSAETETRERPHSSSSRQTGLSQKSLQEVARGYSSPPLRTPIRTPNTLQKGFMTHDNQSGNLITASPKSDRSYFSRLKETREMSPGAKDAAAAAKARAIERGARQSPQFEIAESTPTRGLSPIQSEASYREEPRLTGSPQQLRQAQSAASMSSAGRKVERQQSNLSIQSFDSRPSTKAARTRKRPQGVSLEKPKEIFGDPDTPRDVDDFFEENHEQNEMYRREYEASQKDSPGPDSRRMTGYTEDSELGEIPAEAPREERLSLSQDIRKVGSIPEYVHTPLAVESAVASLVEPSSISVHSSVASPVKKSRLSHVSPSPEYEYMEEETKARDSPSRDRWNAIRGQAQTLATRPGAASSPRHSLSASAKDEPQMHHNAIPTGHMEPEFGYIDDDASDVITNPSIIKGPLGMQDFDDRSEMLVSRQEERERTPSRSYGKTAAVGAGTVAAAIAAREANSSRNQSPAYSAQRGSMTSDEYDQQYDTQHLHAQPSYSQNRTPSRSPALWRDEGYQSAHQPGAVTPDMRYNSGQVDDLDDYPDTPTNEAPNPFAADGKHARNISGNSHGMDSPLYDSATGQGLDRIESKDIVALMDHLTVRDAQRNARDTEILVTLVRSAAEMRNTFEELKQFIRVQDNMVMNNTDKRVDMAEQRILGGPRPQPAGSPRAPRSSTEELDFETKKKNVFKRALKGLGSKGDKDIKNIESMLIQLLGEVEGLKQIQQINMDQSNRANSMNSYENMRASGGPESGYEPEGRANTASSPNQSGYLSNPSSRRIQDMHSGFDVPPTHRVSTVAEEDDEEYEEEPQYENTERMTTPTQEARRNNSISQETPPQASKPFRDSQSLDNTPKRKHKSTSSSIFGIPKISRWSKTTASTNAESLPRNSIGDRRPESIASQSGSQVDLPYGNAQYELQEDDRIRSQTSLARDGRESIRDGRESIRDGRESIRSASPLIPEDAEQYAMEDPKYQAHRNSLNLQHPQPRPGPTGRHHNQLETQARIFHSVSSPVYDQWGSNPSLARNRLSGGAAPYGAGHLSPISSEGGYSETSASDQQQAPQRPPKIPDDGPLIPPQQQPLAGHGQARQMYSSPNEYGGQGTLTPLAPIQEVRYSLETESGLRYTPEPSPRPSSQNLRASTGPGASMASPQRKITGPRPMGSRSPNPAAQQQGLQHSDTVIRRKPVERDFDEESLESYRSSLDSEIF